MENEEDVDPPLEIRVVLRKVKGEDKELYEDFKKIMEKLYPIKKSEIGKMLIKRGIDNWKKEKGN